MSAVRHPYLHARVAILAGRLLPLSVLENLVTQPPEKVSPEAMPQATLEDILEGHLVTPARAEQVLLPGLLADFLILVRPLAGVERDFLVYWLRKYEIANIKAIVRGKIAGLTAEAIRRELADIHPFATLPIEDLLRTEDTAEMLRLLETHTPYGEAARQGRQVYERKRELFMLEATIDHRYLAGVLRRVNALDAVERAEVAPLVNYVIERFNLMWLLRYRFTYGLSPAETYYLLLIHTHHRLIQNDLGALAQLGSVEEVVSRLPPALRERLADQRSLTGIEQVVEEVVREVARAALARSSSALARAFAYLLLRECQMNRILAIVKGRHLGLPAQIIRDGASLMENGGGDLNG